jgi:hypothetical protein
VLANNIFLPGFTQYRDSLSDDTGGKTFTQCANLPRYTCPIQHEVPLRRDEEEEGRRADIFQIAEMPTALDAQIHAQLLNALQPALRVMDSWPPRKSGEGAVVRGKAGGALDAAKAARAWRRSSDERGASPEPARNEGAGAAGAAPEAAARMEATSIGSGLPGTPPMDRNRLGTDRRTVG